ncbi:MAG: aminotransferase class I/II-fold pyridoxal phosphate-dependent enzyme [Deltaproteobacteria bacterium]|nr:aminotransferase class I/II-fold pyridoxal phosphate-dependent enzyme [Deltaproteobacteria bacterium]
MKGIRIDLASDTVTKPTPEMRKFIASAEVGDEQRKEDTMCNQVAIRVHCSHGDEIVMDQTAHTRHYEAGGPAALTGVSIYPLEGERGIFSSEQFESAIRPDDNHFPRTRMVLVEQTSNVGGGSIWPLETMRAISEIALKHGIASHMDGARLLNAVIATGIPAREYAALFDSVWIDFSKGLGAPVGAALAGSRVFIKEAWRWKHQFGGAMRQAGIIAAAAVYALEHHVERLAEDHENARILAEGLSAIEGIRVEPVDTNIIFFEVSDLGLTAAQFNQMLMSKGVRVSPTFGHRVRAVTHLDVTRSQVEEAIDIIRRVADETKG